MDFRAQVLVYCSGLCEAFVHVPFKGATTFLTEDGSWAKCVRTSYVCQDCQDWFNWVTENLEVKGVHNETQSER